MKQVVVTGTARGIGRAIALKFLSCGHPVAGIDRAGGTIEHPGYTHYTADILTDPLPDIPRVGILINNAGVQNTGMDIDINLKGTIRVTEKYAMQQNISSVLFIASASARTGSEFPEYAASKGGMVAYMKNTALRVAAYGATANSLSPGGVLTDLNRHIIDTPALWEQVMAQTLLPKWASTEEIAEWAYFVTAVNRSMTAQDILIDNGEEANCHFVW